MEAIAAFASVLQPEPLLGALVGVALGITVGALPGLTAAMTVALLVPFTFALSPLASLLMLVGVHAGANYGGSISAILLRTPGTPAAAATLIDGYPMAESGRGRQALRIALFASVVGGLVSVIAMSQLAPLISGFALLFGPSEYFAVGVFGLTVIVAVAGPSLIKGLAAGAIGLMFALVGLDPVAGYPRFTFDKMELLGGLPFLAALIGLFALTEAFRRIEQIGLSRLGKQRGSDRSRLSMREALQLFPTTLKGGAIGTFVGVLPGAGADIAAFISYNEARRSARDRSTFGKGEPRGVAAAESANNGITGGAMIPLLTLGIPGDAVTAVLIGAFTIHGIRPGPLLFETHLETIVYPLFAGMFIINLMMGAIGWFATSVAARVSLLPHGFIVSMIIILSTVGAYAIQFSMFDVYIMLGFGILGYLLNRQGFPVSPIVLALILGPMIEGNLRRALVLNTGDFGAVVTTPIAATIFILTAITVVFSVVTIRRATSSLPGVDDPSAGEENENSPRPNKGEPT